MATHPGMLLAYDAAGNVVATLSHMVQSDDDGNAVGIVDFASHEEAGGDHVDIWVVDSGDPTRPVRGSKVWPEWLGPAASDFRVELEGKAGAKRIGALIHKESGHRRERAIAESNVAQRIAVYAPEPADIRDLVGGPDRPVPLDEQGRTGPTRPVRAAAHLPLLRTDVATKPK